MTTPNQNKRNLAIGALLGLAVGDALGAPVEFKARDSFDPVTDMISGGAFNLPSGFWTDDTSMACGQIAGAYYGLDNIPTYWLDKLHDKERLIQVADNLFVAKYAKA